MESSQSIESLRENRSKRWRTRSPVNAAVTDVPAMPEGSGVSRKERSAPAAARAATRPGTDSSSLCADSITRRSCGYARRKRRISWIAKSVPASGQESRPIRARAARARAADERSETARASSLTARSIDPLACRTVGHAKYHAALSCYCRPMKRRAALLGLAIAACTAARAQDLAAFEKRTVSGRLDNGLQYVVCERPEAPVVSFFTRVDVGSAQEVPGITGLAHMFEHMAFKGTETIGTTDWPAEKKALESVEAAYAAYDRVRRRPVGRDEAEVRRLEAA